VRRSRPDWAGRHIVALAGGVGGSRFARGLAAAAPLARLSVVVNTGDDVRVHGLPVSPDVDTVLYALSGTVDERRGWGPRRDSFRCMQALDRLGGETWFQLGDLDLATHLRRAELFETGWTPTAVTTELALRLGVPEHVRVLPMTDAQVATWVQLDEDGRWVHFQEYFVKRRADVAIRGVRFEGIESARATPQVLEALAQADLVAFCPSNPFVSLAPILALDGVRDAIQAVRRRGGVIAGVSPILGGQTVKGPAARMLRELGHPPTAAGVAAYYAGLLDFFLIDAVDADLADQVTATGARPIVADALMRNRRGEARLARLLLSKAKAA
jgi:LPPG:FO 2-phospho-L-lactate transferase